MRTEKKSQRETLERLFAKFNDELRCTGNINYGLLVECPEEIRPEFKKLMNVAGLAYRALEPARRALQLQADKTKVH
jgi:hypothetical protein